MPCAVGGWLVILGVSFSGGIYVNSYYLAALSPALAAICGLGVDLYWRHRHEQQAGRLLGVTVALTAGYGAFLISGGVGVPRWILPTCVGVMAVGAIAAITGSLGGRARSPSALGWLALTTLAVFPATASALVVSRGLGPFDIPYETHHTVKVGSTSEIQTRLRAYLKLAQHLERTRIAFGVYTSYLASPYIFYTGDEILPLGGFSGMSPTPTVRVFVHDISTAQVRAVLVPVRLAVDDRLVRWIRTHCTQQRLTPAFAGVQIGEFYCAPHRSARTASCALRPARSLPRVGGRYGLDF